MPEIERILMGSVGVIVLFYFTFAVFPLAYVFVRWRAGSDSEPGNGTYAGLLYFRAVSLLVFCTGLSLCLHSLIDEDAGRRSMENMRRVAAGLMVGGLVFHLLQWAFISQLSSAAKSVQVRRVFRGFVLVVSGLVSMGTVILLCVLMFDEHTHFEDFKPLLAWVGVWTILHLGHLQLLRA